MATALNGNGVKPRYDGGGTEFGLMHRDLGPGYLMFDVDRISAVLEVGLELRRENEGFVEYRRKGDEVRFVALFEVKHRRTEYSEAALDKTTSNAMARLAMARCMCARLFVVFATDGKPPFNFYEVDTETGDPVLAGTLTYTPQTRAAELSAFWNNVLRIPRDFESYPPMK